MTIHDSSRSLSLARNVTSLAHATGLERAIENFHAEYGALPDVSNHLTTDSADGVKLLVILLGIEPESDTVRNPRMIRFLNFLREGKNKRGGLIYNSTRTLPDGLYDAGAIRSPWNWPSPASRTSTSPSVQRRSICRAARSRFTRREWTRRWERRTISGRGEVQGGWASRPPCPWVVKTRDFQSILSQPVGMRVWSSRSLPVRPRSLRFRDLRVAIRAGIPLPSHRKLKVHDTHHYRSTG